MHMVPLWKYICEQTSESWMSLVYCLAGSRLQLLKEQLQKQMKVKRAEVRKIQESQRKLDNEEMSEEEEEEMTDEEGMTLKIVCHY